MQLKIYNTESFDRGRLRYIVFGVVMSSVFLLAILNQNIAGAIVLFFILGGYFYYSISNIRSTVVSITQQGLIIGLKSYSWNILKGYVLEIDLNTKTIKNIVFVTINGHTIHTIVDSLDNTKNFIISLNEYIPMLGNYDQNFIEKFSRKLKI